MFFGLCVAVWVTGFASILALGDFIIKFLKYLEWDKAQQEQQNH